MPMRVGVPQASFITIAADGTLQNERVLTGTANQVTVTDSGAGAAVTLSTPQDIHTGASPTFAAVTVSGALTVDTTTLVVDATNNRVGLGTASPSTTAHATGTNNYSAYTDLTSASRQSSYIFSTSLTDDTFTTPYWPLIVELLANFSSTPGTKAVNLIEPFATVSSGATVVSGLTVRGIAPTLTYSGTNTLANLMGCVGTNTNSSTGTVTTSTGYRFGMTNSNASGVITTASHFTVSVLTNNGTITSTYGYFCDDISAGTQTNGAWAFFNSDSGSKSNFNATVSVGGGATAAAANVLRATTDGTNCLRIFDGTAPVGTLTNGIDLYSTAGELRVMDSGGNATLLSQHDKTTNEWIFESKHTPSGKYLRIDMERLMRKLDAMLGGGYINEIEAT